MADLSTLKAGDTGGGGGGITKVGKTSIGASSYALSAIRTYALVKLSLTDGQYLSGIQVYMDTTGDVGACFGAWSDDTGSPDELLSSGGFTTNNNNQINFSGKRWYGTAIEYYSDGSNDIWIGIYSGGVDPGAKNIAYDAGGGTSWLATGSTNEIKDLTGTGSSSTHDFSIYAIVT